MKVERFAGHYEAREALVLSVAGVTTIMLIESLVLLLLLPDDAVISGPNKFGKAIVWLRADAHIASGELHNVTR
jgi:hypothetical protein